MGRGYMTRREELRYERETRERLDAQEKIDRPYVEVAERIAMVVIDRINRVIVRPGPVAEERECYQMAQEIRDHEERITKEIFEVLKVAIRERQFEVIEEDKT